MRVEDFSISGFNETMQNDIAKLPLNLCKALVLSRQKISLTLLHEPRHFHERYAVLKPDLSVDFKSDFSSYYYGASPKIDSFSVMDAISRLTFQSMEGLEGYISEHCTDFMLHEDQAAYLLDVAKLILLTIASKYGIVLKCCTELAFLLDEKNPFSGMISVNQEEGTILLRGCPTVELMERLKPYRFVKRNGAWELHENGLELKEIYTNKNNIKLLVGKVFYSGVLLRPLEINFLKYNFENNGIATYQIIYERSSFATVCAFDDNDLRHPLLEESRERLRKLFDYDDDCKLRLYEALSAEGISEEQTLVHINEYIRCSYNVNQIGVSSNIKTADGEVLFGLRGAKNIDGGALYPSVNGNAEVYDEDVQFYNNSVYEDLPSVYIDQKRSDLQGEIAREAYGELNLTSTKESWSCHGIIISGNLPDADKDKPRRCHFNVLFENEVCETSDEIRQRFHKASESFENKTFSAIRVRCYKNKVYSVFGGIVGFLQYVLRSKDIIESVLLLLVAFISVKTIHFSLEDLSSLLSALFAGIILLTTLIRVVQRICKMARNAKYTKKLRIYGTESYSSLCHKISKVMTASCHPAAYASFKMHIENRILDELKDE